MNIKLIFLFKLFNNKIDSQPILKILSFKINSDSTHNKDKLFTHIKQVIIILY